MKRDHPQPRISAAPGKRKSPSLRGQKVLLDSELARLYGVDRATLIRTVRRNPTRFPDDFLFQLTSEESAELGYPRNALAYAFTPQGAAMLANVLRGPQAIEAGIAITRSFTHLCERLAAPSAWTRNFDARLEGIGFRSNIACEAIRRLAAPSRNRQNGTDDAPRKRGRRSRFDVPCTVHHADSPNVSCTVHGDADREKKPHPCTVHEEPPTGRGNRMAVITALNQKGGVGKTSTCHHLAGTLAAMGKRILLIDNDPQASLTQGFWGPAAARRIDPAETVAALYAGDNPFPAQIIKPTGIPGIDLIPGSKAATRYNVPMPHEADPAVQMCLREFLAEVRSGYDLVLIDCPPNLHMASWAALVASDHLIVPLKPEDYGAQGIIDVHESTALVQAGPNPSLTLLGYLLTLVNPRKTVHKLYEETLREQYGAAVFTTRMAEAVDYVEALNQRLPVAQYKPKGAAAKTMKALAEELNERLAAVVQHMTRGAA